MELLGVVNKKFGFLVVCFLKVFCRDLQGLIDTFPDSNAGHYNYKFGSAETLIHFKNVFYIAIGFPGSGLHLHVKV